MESGKYQQMHMFDFIEPEKSLFDRLFGKINDPVFYCINCLCNHCTNNAENLHINVRPEEVQEPCFNCDECYEFTDNHKHRRCDKENCDRFIISNYGAQRKRRGIKVVK